jgi:hypothetical protein
VRQAWRGVGKSEEEMHRVADRGLRWEIAPRPRRSHGGLPFLSYLDNANESRADLGIMQEGLNCANVVRHKLQH